MVALIWLCNVVSFFVFYHCDEPISFPFVCFPVWLFPVLEPFSFPVFDYVSLVFEIVVIPRFPYSCSDLLDLLWCYFIQGSKYFRVSWLVASSRLLVLSIAALLNTSVNCCILLSVRLQTFFVSALALGLGMLVLSVIILWSDMYDPGTRDPV